MNMMWIAYAVMWASTSGAIGFAVYFTGSAMPLWALLIPASISIRSDDENKAG